MKIAVENFMTVIKVYKNHTKQNYVYVSITMHTSIF